MDAAAVARRPPAAPPARPTSPATPTGPSSASTSSTPPTPTGAASASSSCAASRCRPTRGWRSSRRCSCGPSSPGSGTSPTPARSCAGAPAPRPLPAARDRRGRPADVVADLNRFLERATALAPSTPDWLDPFLEFRFPRLGTCRSPVSSSSCGAAVEPWHVLGEEVALGGTSRYVDSSVERLQVGAVGLVPGRHVVTCNGRAGAARPVDRPRPRRRRASATGPGRRPPRCTRPSGCTPRSSSTSSTLAVGRSLGGFTYHVVHPGGRSYDDPPVNAIEAEARRSARFRHHGR